MVFAHAWMFQRTIDEHATILVWRLGLFAPVVFMGAMGWDAATLDVLGSGTGYSAPNVSATCRHGKTRTTMCSTSCASRSRCAAASRLRRAGSRERFKTGWRAADCRRCTARPAAFLDHAVLDAGENLRAVADHLGHADTAVTDRTYMHTVRRLQDATALRVADLIASKRGGGR